MKTNAERRDPSLDALLRAHGATRVARVLTISRQAVYAWRVVPERRLDKIARAFRMTRHRLRPDIYARNGRRVTKDIP